MFRKCLNNLIYFFSAAQITYARNQRSELPSAVDLQEASHNIELLVDYYELEPKDLAAGKLARHSYAKFVLKLTLKYQLIE